MKRHETALSPELPDDLRAHLETVPSVSPEDLTRLGAAAESLDADPSFQAEYLKSLFVEKMLEMLKERRESQSDLARRWGKTRQYVSKLFREDKRVNFTIETLCEMAHQVGLRVDIRVLRTDQPELAAGSETRREGKAAPVVRHREAAEVGCGLATRNLLRPVG